MKENIATNSEMKTVDTVRHYGIYFKKFLESLFTKFNTFFFLVSYLSSLILKEDIKSYLMKFVNIIFPIWSQRVCDLSEKNFKILCNVRSQMNSEKTTQLRNKRDNNKRDEVIFLSFLEFRKFISCGSEYLLSRDSYQLARKQIKSVFLRAMKPQMN